MRRKSHSPLLSTIILVAVTGSSLPIASTVAAPAKSAVTVPAKAAVTVPVKAVANQKITNNAYIVRMAEKPVVAYTGNIKGYAATRPPKGQRIDPNHPAVVRYMALLESRHDAALARVGVGVSKKLYSYGFVFNGFAAEMTEVQAAKLAQIPGVLAVSKDEFRELVTSTTPNFLGLSGDGGFWDTTSKGENVVIGIIDSGVWPEHPSFSDVGTGKGKSRGKIYTQPLHDWRGSCQAGEEFTAANCNGKLIGARYYNAGFGGDAGIDANLPFEFNSPRDHNGHGTHTATTAGGNANVPATGPAAVLGSISGIAPRARIAAYKACWSVPGTAGSCSGVDLVAAIDQAVADGVDVINYSISGTRTNFRDPVEIAFLFAADAGVFVAASAGNSGPAAATVAHPSPWITTVAAGTHDRDGAGSTTLGNGSTYNGASLATLGATGPAPLIDATDAVLPGIDPYFARLCYSTADTGGVPVLDPAKIAGKVVVCDRGDTARVNKSLAVKDAGGVGMILLNTSVASVNADLHSVPSVHLQYDAMIYDAVHAYARAAGATATINQASITNSAPAPFTASFSSRGPLQASGDLLKPDIIAPGQDILAGVAPPNNGGKLFDLYSGTSMSSPHVAGIAALLKSAYPTWSPMAIKSAIMTTAGDVLDGPNTSATVIFRQGAGHVRPNLAANPGLVFDSSYNDWLGFLCGTQLPTSFCTSAGVPVLEPSNFNSPSIAISNLPGTKTVKRRVTNVGGSTATYTTSADMPGFTVTVTPAPLTLAAGETKEIEITVTATTALPNSYQGGQLTLTDGVHTVRIPIVARPVLFRAPTEVTGSYSITFGYTGSFTATARGLVPADVTAGNVFQDPDQIFDPNDPTGTIAVQVVVPAGTTYARFGLFDADVAPGSDVDLYVYGPTGNPVGQSFNGGSDETVNISNPAAGTYTVFMHGWGLPNGSSPFKLHAWVLGATATGNMTVTAPTEATAGQTATVGLGFSGLAPATRYLGSVAYSGVAGLPAPTIVRVDTP
jgi:subtilisin family serine protease